jgi:hypothetical protein
MVSMCGATKVNENVHRKIFRRDNAWPNDNGHYIIRLFYLDSLYPVFFEGATMNHFRRPVRPRHENLVLAVCRDCRLPGKATRSARRWGLARCEYCGGPLVRPPRGYGSLTMAGRELYARIAPHAERPIRHAAAAKSGDSRA